jgi:hypothetical protein
VTSTFATHTGVKVDLAGVMSPRWDRPLLRPFIPGHRRPIAVTSTFATYTGVKVDLAVVMSDTRALKTRKARQRRASNDDS